MRSSMRLFCNVGNEAPRVLVYIQKPRKTRGTEAQAIQFIARNWDTTTQMLLGNSEGCYGHRWREVVGLW